MLCIHFQGIKYLIDNYVLDNNPNEIAKFIQGTSTLSSKSLQNFLKDRYVSFIRQEDIANKILRCC